MDNKEKNKKTMLEDVFTDLQSLMEAATKKAKIELDKDFPKKMDNILKEAIEKTKNKESAKDKKLNESYHEDEQELDEEIDMTEMSMDEVKEAYTNADEEDEFDITEDIDLEDIENELNSMDDVSDEQVDAPQEPVDMESQLQDEMSGIEESMESDPYGAIKKIAEMANRIVKEKEEMETKNGLSEKFQKHMQEMYGDDYKETIGEDKVGELEEAYINKSKMKSEGDHKHMADEKKHDDKEGEDVMNELEISDENEQELDEILSLSHSAQRGVQGGKNPNIDVAGKHRNSVTRPEMRSESEKKKLDSLISENKKLRKKLSEQKTSKEEAEKLVEKQNVILGKFRTQLQEMAIYNTNIAHVNNLLINENLDLSFDDKVNVINKFKNVTNIDESKKLYTKTLNEMSESHKTNLDEALENKVSDKVSVDKPNKNVVEKTAYTNNEHVNKIKKIMEYVDKGGKQI